MAVTKSHLVQQMQALASAQDAETTDTLRKLTAELLTVCSADARHEIATFKAVQKRGYQLQVDALRKHLSGKRILITGGTGCIGSALIEQLMQYNPAQVTSVSRMTSDPFRPHHPGVDYRRVDIRASRGVIRVFDEVKPDIVYHLAAQRDPGAAEKQMARTIATNVQGVLNVIRGAEEHGTQVVYASTGKALRPFTPDIYAATKMVGEWLFAQASESIRCSGVRFTHVVDNSIIYRRLQQWIASDEAIRLHGTEILFYLQSAHESAQLLLNSGLEAENGTFTLQAIRDLGWPANLLGLALGALADADRVVPIRIIGHESGYEKEAYPALYDPMYSGEVSPLINGLEAPRVKPSDTCKEFDRFPITTAPHEGAATALQGLLDVHEGAACTSQLQPRFEELCWQMLDARLPHTPEVARQRAVNRYDKWKAHHRGSIIPEHQRITDAIVRSLG